MVRTRMAALACAAIALATSASAGDGWTAPACDSVTGTPAVTFTRDEGKTLAPTDGDLAGVGYTFGLVALDAANTLVAEHEGSVLRSTDAGCTWSEIGAVERFPLTLSAAAGGRAYGWSDNGDALYRIDGETVTPLVSPVEAIVGLAADPADGARVRLGDGTGQVWESTNAGDDWTRVGRPVASEQIVYRVAFDPNDLDRVFVGASTIGLSRSEDGGATWTPATGLSSTGRANVFNVVVSPADGDVVWAMGLDLSDDARHVYRSKDGGATFKRVVNDTRRVTLVNGNLMAAHPTNPKVLYFVFGTSFQGYGTDVYRYDTRTKKVTKTHNAYDGVSSIAFDPADASVMYLGLTSEDID